MLTDSQREAQADADQPGAPKKKLTREERLARIKAQSKIDMQEMEAQSERRLNQMYAGFAAEAQKRREQKALQSAAINPPPSASSLSELEQREQQLKQQADTHGVAHQSSSSAVVRARSGSQPPTYEEAMEAPSAPPMPAEEERRMEKAERREKAAADTSAYRPTSILRPLDTNIQQRPLAYNPAVVQKPFAVSQQSGASFAPKISSLTSAIYRANDKEVKRCLDEGAVITDEIFSDLSGMYGYDQNHESAAQVLKLILNRRTFAHNEQLHILTSIIIGGEDHFNESINFLFEDSVKNKALVLTESDKASMLQWLEKYKHKYVRGSYPQVQNFLRDPLGYMTAVRAREQAKANLLMYQRQQELQRQRQQATNTFVNNAMQDAAINGLFGTGIPLRF